MNISDFLTSITDNLNFIVRSVILGLLFGILVSYLALDTYKINSRLISLSGELNPIDLVYEPYILTKLQLSGIDRSLEYPYLKYNKHNEILTIVSDNKDTISDDLDLILKTALDDHISRAINEARDIISELKKDNSKNTAIKVAIAKYNLRITELSNKGMDQLIVIRKSSIKEVKPSNSDIIIIFGIIAFFISLLIIRFRSN
tara:strand:- start:1183 stop:1788 length:606 start_codon:yes stop_codon:yes gene_type:complete